MKTIQLHRNAKDLSNQTFNKLKAIAPIGRHHKGTILWHCLCDCGNTTTVTSYRLTSGHTKSCGCNKGGVIQHGKTGSPEFNVWVSMKQRCWNPKNKRFKYYGGRGIKVCKHWNTFAHFLSDMGERPHPKSQIDRIDNDGNYTPENCRWVTPRQQAQNKSNTRNITYQGETRCIRSWSRKLGINYLTLYHRIRNGWSIDRAFTESVGHYHNR